MIEVTGGDGRVHSFAEGTTQAQIDAAMAALYSAPATPTYATAPPIQPPPIQPTPFQSPPTHQTRPISTAQILLGAAAAAVIALVVTLAFIMGRGSPPKTEAQMPRPDSTAPIVPVPQLSPSPAVTAEAFAGYVSTQQGGTLIVRGQPQQTAAQLARLPHGAPISVTGSVLMPDGLWRQVNVGGATGYVKGDFVSQTQPAAIAQAPAPAPAATLASRDFWGTATTRSSDNVNMRASPSTNARVISSIPYGASVYVIGEQGGWYLVEWGGRRGWTSSTYIRRN
jgi:uncharacterized protein YraI